MQRSYRNYLSDVGNYRNGYICPFQNERFGVVAPTNVKVLSLSQRGLFIVSHNSSICAITASTKLKTTNLTMAMIHKGHSIYTLRNKHGNYTIYAGSQANDDEVISSAAARTFGVHMSSTLYRKDWINDKERYSEEVAIWHSSKVGRSGRW